MKFNMDIKNLKKQKNRSRKLFILFGFLLILFFVSYFILSLQKDITPQQRAELQELKEKIREVQNSKEDLKDVIEIRKEWQKEGVSLEDKLLNLGLIVPHDMWLTKIEMEDFNESQNKKKKKAAVSNKGLSIKGQLLSSNKPLNTVTDFIASLADQPAFSSDFKYPSLTSFGLSKENPKIVNFELQMERK
ncbi:MAG: hypothetical protein SWO11_18395 [Thermodesulfobacteriota bacterium]|nr:hypothetical protein [Thermodesulfobacteriota bacterium]